jgi:hypothetical protein
MESEEKSMEKAGVEYYSFNAATIKEAIESVKSDVSTLSVEDVGVSAVEDPHVEAFGGCIAVVIKNHKVCLKLPHGFGNVCLPIPISIKNGTAAQTCLTICTIWPGIPKGVRVRIVVAGNTIISKKYGFC